MANPRRQEVARAWPFDPEATAGTTRVVRTLAVIDLLEVTHAPDRVESFRRAMERGESFPPVAVLPVAGRLLLADGHKRFAAVRKLSPAPEHILVEVWTLGRWLDDQSRQLRTKTAQQIRLLAGSLREPEARSGLRRLVRETLAHWRRIARSLAHHVRRQ